MSHPVRLGVLLLPSPAVAAWRTALALKITERGGLLAKEVRALAAAASDQDVIVLVTDARDARSISVTHWAVLGTDVETALAVASHKNRGYPRKAYKLVAERFAPIPWLRSQGAVVLDAACDTLDFPGIGLVTRGPSDPKPPLDIPLGPSALYKENPPRIGLKVALPLEVFVFKPSSSPLNAPPKIDLTGRGRVVVFGPRHDLPAGRWRVTCRFSIETEGSDIYLKFQWGVGEDLVTVDAMLQHSGTYEVALEHGWVLPDTAELRVWASNAHFLGLMEFLGADIERIDDVPSMSAKPPEPSGVDAT